MQRSKYIMKKIFIMQIIFVIVVAMALNITIKPTKVQAATTKTGIEAFPDSYKEALRTLSREHSNWTFTAFETGLNWQDVMNGEKYPISKNTIQTSNPLYKANGAYDTGGGFYCAAPGVIAYYMDPRNFLTEDRNIPIYGDVI